MDVKFTLTFIASIGALIFSFLNFRRNRKFENENYLYKSKVETYIKIQEELIKLTRCITDNYFEAVKYFENQSQETEKELMEKAESVDQMSHGFADFFLKNSLLMPENIFSSLGDFCTTILDMETLDTETARTSKILPTFKEKFNSIIDEAEEISYLLRDDLHIEKLSVSLYKRLK